VGADNPFVSATHFNFSNKFMRLARFFGSIPTPVPTKIFEWLQSLRALQKKL
jgi:hypothetical protein